METAKTYPEITQLFGIDISSKMLSYARVQAEANQVNDRIEFLVMDALSMLEFPTGFFDLVNMRFAQSYLRTWDWSKILQEAQRVSKPGGVIRFTEVEVGTESTSPALNRLNQLCLQALYQAGHYFISESTGLTAHLAGLMHQHGVQKVQTRAYTFQYYSGTPEGQLCADDTRLAYRTWVPFLKKWVRLPDDYEDIHQQALVDMEAPNFVETWKLLTAWGT
ncbi:MAG TPA: class I SAM-dependent methyltransferase, partial [Ktedonobacteraceae bacterium]